MEFDKRKKATLSTMNSPEPDKSPKGNIDAPIIPLLTTLNSHPCFFTTSSCSGRISVLSTPTSSSTSTPHKKAKGGNWLFITHDPADPISLLSLLFDSAQPPPSSPSTLVFRYEPLIIAVECRDIVSAQSLVSLAISCGFRESGITSVNKKRVIVAIRCSIRLEVPLGDTHKLMVTREYVEFLVGIANDKMEANRRRTDNFLAALLKNGFSEPGTNAGNGKSVLVNQEAGGKDQKTESFLNFSGEGDANSRRRTEDAANCVGFAFVLCDRRENMSRRNEELPKETSGAIPLIEREPVVEGLNTGGRQVLVDELEKAADVEVEVEIQACAAAGANTQMVVVEEGEHINLETLGSSDSNPELLGDGSRVSRKRKDPPTGSGEEREKAKRLLFDLPNTSDPSSPQTRTLGSYSEGMTKEKVIELATQLTQVSSISGVPYLKREGLPLIMGTTVTRRARDVDLVRRLKTVKLSPETYHARLGMIHTELSSMMEAMTSDYRKCIEAERRASDQLVQLVGVKETAELKLAEAEKNVGELTTAYESLMVQKDEALKEVGLLKNDKAKLMLDKEKADADATTFITDLRAAEAKIEKLKTDYDAARGQIEEMKAGHEAALAQAKLDAVKEYKEGNECLLMITEKAKGFFKVGAKHLARRALVDQETKDLISVRKLADLCAEESYDLAARSAHHLVPFDDNDLLIIKEDDETDGKEEWPVPAIDPKNFDAYYAHFVDDGPDPDETPLNVDDQQ